MNEKNTKNTEDFKEVYPFMTEGEKKEHGKRQAEELTFKEFVEMGKIAIEKLARIMQRSEVSTYTSLHSTLLQSDLTREDFMLCFINFYSYYVKEV